MQLSWGCGHLSARHLCARERKQPSCRRVYSLRAHAWRQTAADDDRDPEDAPRDCGDVALSRRLALLGLATASVSCSHAQCLGPVHASEQQQNTPSTAMAGIEALPIVDYSMPGPLAAAPFPELEHTCSRCFPACLGNRCMLRLDVVYPKNGKAQGMLPPYPLAIISSGFLTAASSYLSYARRLATWGYTVVLYDKVESATEPLDDRLCVELIREIIDWAKSDPVVSQLADTDTTYLCGHSRGGKVSALAAAVDPRVKAVCLLDPVDVTVYTPQGPDFPSAVAAIRHMSRGVPLAIVGSGRAGDCVPKDSNYKRYYNACQGPAWEVVLGSAGHFQFLDEQTMLQRAVCAVGPIEDSSVREVAQTVMVAWGEIMLKGRALSSPEPAPPELRDGDLVAALPSESEATRQALLAAQHLFVQNDRNKIDLTARLKNIN